VWARIIVYGSSVLIVVASFAAAFVLIPPHSGIFPVVFGWAAGLVLVRLSRLLLRRPVPVSLVRECRFAAPPERVRALLSSAEAWSLRTGCHAFDVPLPQDMPPLHAIIRVGSRAVSCSAQELIALPPTEGRPGRSLLVRPVAPSGSPPSLTVWVVPEGSGTRVVVTERQRARLANVFDVKAAGREVVAAWLRECAAVLAGDRDWPGQEMSPDVLAALAAPLAAPAAAEDVTEASASALIAADPATVWEVVWDPATTLPESGKVAAGFVPGRPVGRTGETQYEISKSSRLGGALILHVYYVCDMEPGRMARVRTSGPVPGETLYHIEPEYGGTRLSLTGRFIHRRQRGQQEKVQAHMEEAAARYKVLLEGTNAPDRS
jgi:hypothetical protein